MARYIDIEPLEKEGWYMARVYNDSLTSQTYETKKLKDFSTVDVVERKRGEWVSLNGWITCSECGSEPPNETNIESDFCPNCGADMRGDFENEQT